MKRRDFLIKTGAGLASVVLPAKLAQGSLCPPPNPRLDGENSVSNSCANGALPSFTLTSSTGRSLSPFTLGQVFKMGDVPSGQFIVASIPNFQADVRNRWSDGSVKFAVLSGRINLSAGSATTVSLQRTETAPRRVLLSERDLRSVAPNASVSLGGYGTVTLGALLGSPVRSMLGSEMSEFHYRAPVGSDAHLAVWFYVRLYTGNAVEIETCVENGYMKVASPTDRSYSATVTVNGTVRYSGSLTHWARTRWATVSWYDGTNGLTDFARVVPSHDPAYLCATKLVPNYALGSAPSGSYLDGLPQAIAPLGNANHQPGSMANAGSSDHIGILPRWDAAYCTTGDARAYRAVLVNSYASNSWPVCYRDEGTQRPLALASRPNIDAAGWNIDPVVYHSTSNSNYFGAGTVAHMPSAGYLAYLLTGRWSHLETAAFWATRSHMQFNPNNRGHGFATIPGAEDRGKGWHIRSAMQAAAIYPDLPPTVADAMVRSDLIAALGATFKFWQANVLTCPLGYIGDMYNPGLYGGLPDLIVGVFQGYFVTQCIGYVWDLDLLSGTARSAHAACRDHFYKLPVGMLGDSSGWCYRNGPRYAAVLGSYDGSTISWFADWEAAETRAIARGDVSSSSCPLNSSIDSGHFPDATSYGGNLLPAIAYAVDHGFPGASTAYSRFSSASNFGAFANALGDATQWAVVPR